MCPFVLQSVSLKIRMCGEQRVKGLAGESEPLTIPLQQVRRATTYIGQVNIVLMMLLALIANIVVSEIIPESLATSLNRPSMSAALTYIVALTVDAVSLELGP
jgi:hypothetical protein